MSIFCYLNMFCIVENTRSATEHEKDTPESCNFPSIPTRAKHINALTMETYHFCTIILKPETHMCARIKMCLYRDTYVRRPDARVSTLQKSTH
jgi:hypothetical protein